MYLKRGLGTSCYEQNTPDMLPIVTDTRLKGTYFMRIGHGSRKGIVLQDLIPVIGLKVK